MTELEDAAREIVAAGAPGALVLAVDARGSRAAAAGVADLETGRPVALDDTFGIASITKTFVAALALRLVERGVLDLDEPVVEAAAPGITLRRLLNHTSGLPDYATHPAVAATWRDDRGRAWSPQELVALALEQPPLFEPGAGWAYSNTNYVVAGLSLERAAGRKADELLRSEILEPLGLRRTTTLQQSVAKSLTTRAYLPGGTPFTPGSPGALVESSGLGASGSWTSGSLISTADEVACFLGALLRGEVLSRPLLNELLDAVETDWPESDGYGLGIERVSSCFGVVESPCGAGWGHVGLGPWTSVALSTEDGGRQAVVVANRGFLEEPALRAVGSAVWAAFCGE